MSADSDVTEIVGFDLGDGEFSLFLAKMTDNELASLEIENNRSQITAIAYPPDGDPLIGKAAAQAPASMQPRLHFKCMPGSEHWEENQPHVLAFAQQCYQALLRQGRIAGRKKSLVYVGCPSGWSERGVKLYEETLQKGIPGVKVVAESRAAFLFARDSKVLTEEDLRKAALIIDVGSSTTDLTHVKDMQANEFKLGENLGASELDRMLLELELQRSEDREQLEALRENEGIETCLLLAAREAKEKFFRSGALQKGTALAELDSQIDFVIRCNAKDMNTILEQSANGQPSWRDRFVNLLNRARTELTRKKQLPAVILLTGGASRMQFIAEAVQEAFPQAVVKHSLEPEYMVARGLAALGRWEIRVKRFLNAVDDYCHSAELKQQVESELKELITAIDRPLTDALIDEIVCPLAMKALDGDQSVRGDWDSAFTESVRTRAKEWMDDEAGARVWRPMFDKHTKAIRKTVRAALSKICEQFYLSPERMKVQIRPGKGLLETHALIDGVLKMQWMNKILNMSATAIQKVVETVPLLRGPVKLLAQGTLWGMKQETRLVRGMGGSYIVGEATLQHMVQQLQDEIFREAKAMADEAKMYIP